jgi:hypothetical protein
MSQISLETKSDLSAEAVIAAAKQKFIDELGMDLKEEAECCLRLEGGGGFVNIQAEPQEDGTKVVLQGREWTFHLKDFAASIAK